VLCHESNGDATAAAVEQSGRISQTAAAEGLGLPQLCQPGVTYADRRFIQLMREPRFRRRAPLTRNRPAKSHSSRARSCGGLARRRRSAGSGPRGKLAPGLVTPTASRCRAVGRLRELGWPTVSRFEALEFVRSGRDFRAVDAAVQPANASVSAAPTRALMPSFQRSGVGESDPVDRDCRT
jgi:hypothetical protein